MEYDNMLRSPNENNPPSVFRFDAYPGQSASFPWDAAVHQESKYENAPGQPQNPPMFAGFMPIEPLPSPVAPQVPSSFSFGSSSSNAMTLSGQFPFHTSSQGFPDQRVRLILGKRKTDSPTFQPCKQLITEEKMAEHMSKLHISSETASSPLEPESMKNKRLYMCEEMRKLQTEPLLPASLIAQMQQPCTALVLWQPPSKVLPVLGTQPDSDTKDENPISDEPSSSGNLESVDMDGEFGGTMDLDS